MKNKFERFTPKLTDTLVMNCFKIFSIPYPQQCRKLRGQNLGVSMTLPRLFPRRALKIVSKPFSSSCIGIIVSVVTVTHGRKFESLAKKHMN